MVGHGLPGAQDGFLTLRSTGKDRPKPLDQQSAEELHFLVALARLVSIATLGTIAHSSPPTVPELQGVAGAGPLEGNDKLGHRRRAADLLISRGPLNAKWHADTATTEAWFARLSVQLIIRKVGG
jgi:hypothetical protein